VELVEQMRKLVDCLCFRTIHFRLCSSLFHKVSDLWNRVSEFWFVFDVCGRVIKTKNQRAESHIAQCKRKPRHSCKLGEVRKCNIFAVHLNELFANLKRGLQNRRSDVAAHVDEDVLLSEVPGLDLSYQTVVLIES